MDTEKVRIIQKQENENPSWKKLIVESKIPQKLSPLRELSKNLWWVWNNEIRDLFEEINGEIWEECEHNPVVLLESVSSQRYNELENDEAFLGRMNHCYNVFNTYLEERKKPGRASNCLFQYGIWITR